MFKFVFGIFFIVLGVYFIYLALRLQTTRDIGLIKNNMVNIDKIKDKDGYIRFNFKLHMLVGIIYIIQGIISILARYFIFMDNVYSFMDIIVIITIFTYVYKITFKATKFYKG
ncbi:hypothetical protein [Paraclostridium sordellii]|uniref:hypothetical protein n=1 Tax=Paraclostridium sordellii TaxID=1505 RepID=UPI0005E066BC|nr:hypothetical protein [Paeniclostridium sordellii]MCQ4696709.1 hypothetical protein [Paeniclostridium sordellii]MDU6483102.1 hypothetical protein [Paeniclostridium sordellii]CEN83829.1 Uncharacterised protein [[Clostridium] sordellii] [Paeniclostridium sordellii]CEO10249.1 Uncharacterised protein [[Clostridium] sordellii] [Paeniclostridium sordellii]CEO20414.1 Uncharacterised protein [[Clostridium] sordellii] [Paeniclostridium sordellii]